MSDPTDNSNKKLKDLLDKTGKPEDSFADDFEKEAAEGFAMFDKEESLELKQKLDAKIYTEVLSKQKKPTVYWFAAAGLLLIIGLSIFFIRDQQTDESSKLAIATPSEQKEIELTPPPPAEPLVEKPKPEPALVGKKIESDKNSAQPQKSRKRMSDEKEEAFDEASAYSPPTADAAPVAAAPQAMGSSAGIARESEMDMVENDKKATPQSIEPVAPALAYSSGRAMEKSEAYPMNKKSAAFKSKDMKPSCYYIGGDEALQKDLREKLISKNLLQKFDAVVFINSDKKLEQVKFKKTYDLSNEQQQQVIVILKTLTKFDYSDELKDQKLLEYTIDFRP